MSPHVSPCSFGCSQGVNTDSGGNSTSGTGGFCVCSAQEVKNSGRSSAAATLVILDCFTIFPLVVCALLAQLLLSPLLFGHYCAITGVIRAQCGDQSCLLRQRLFLLCSLLACQLQPVRQQRAVTAKKDSHQQQKHQAAAGDLAHPAVHNWPQVQTVFSTSRRVISPFHSLPPAYFQRFSSPHAPAGSPAFNFFSIVEPINAYGPTLNENE
ncbi:Uncharacterised protein [Serratia marcescens]|nr:Uncharacterised protein [Serratia marcescens]